MVRIESGAVTGVNMEAGIRPVAYGMVAAYLLAGAGVLLTAWLRTGQIDQPGTLIVAGLALIAGLIMAALLSMMRDPRGMLFFGTFFGLVVAPHVIVFTLFPDRFSQGAEPDPFTIAAETPAPQGPQVEAPVQVTDITAGVLDARRATLAAYSDGSQVIEIVYDGEAQARLRFLAEYQNEPPPLSELAGHHGVLVQEERYATFHSNQGRRLLRITAVAPSLIEKRLRQMDAPPPAPATKAAAPAKAQPELPLGPFFAGLAVYGIFVVWVFFRMATWAASYAAPPGIPVQSEVALRQRLLQLAREDLPFTVRAGETPQELIAEWRYADATWVDLMRARHVSRLVRYRLRLDEDTAQVYVREFQAAFDASAGAGGADLSYRAVWGITFFDKQVEGVLGLQIRDGKPTRDLAHVWRFDIDEMRTPLVQAINEAGWGWRHVLIDLPFLTR